MKLEHIYPEGYRPELGLLDTQRAIKALKDSFQQQLSASLNLTRVSAPLFVPKDTGLNDDLNGTERKVSFDVKDAPGRDVEVVQSLAKWKRYALGRYGYEPGSGIYTDMNAIRRDEVTDNLHSVYVDQWDWEKVIRRQERTLDTLYDAVNRIHRSILDAEDMLHSRFPVLMPRLPERISFITSEELRRMYPDLTPEEREAVYTRDKKAVFIAQIGGALGDGKPHGFRAPDYDDWSLNGDILYYHRELDCALEISSMGIRVDEDAMRAQLRLSGHEERASLPFHSALLRGELPLTMGGGIGQSRLCMLLLHKAHVGEVQCGVWPEEVTRMYTEQGVTLL